MKIKSQKSLFIITGLIFGLLATLFWMHMSSAIDATPALMGIVSAVWCAFLVSIVVGITAKSTK